MTTNLTPQTERSNRRRLNLALTTFCYGPKQGLPVHEMAALVTEHGFDGTALEGIYCGHAGKVHEQIGARTWLTFTWYRLEVSGLYEIVAYAS